MVEVRSRENKTTHALVHDAKRGEVSVNEVRVQALRSERRQLLQGWNLATP